MSICLYFFLLFYLLFKIFSNITIIKIVINNIKIKTIIFDIILLLWYCFDFSHFFITFFLKCKYF